MFKAIVIEKGAEGHRATLQQVEEAALPEGDVTVKVDYSTLNYKDGLAITGKAPVPVPTTSRRRCQGISSSMERGV